MRHKKLFAFLSVLLSAGIVAAAASHLLLKPEIEFQPGTESPWSAPASSSAFGNLGTSPAFGTDSSMLTGVSQQVPERESMRKLSAIPWTLSDVAKEFKRAGRASACQLLAPGMATFERMAAARPNVASPIGRLPLFSVALSMPLEVRNSLPKLSKASIESYMADHVLIIQTPLYSAADGTKFLGEQLQAAFCAVKSPGTTIQPEKMISDSVAQFRTLGVYVKDETQSIADTRTVVLGFKYAADDSALAASASMRLEDYELLFVHMLKTEDGAAPAIVVFATSNQRTQLHELDLGNIQELTRSPSIISKVRFDDFTTMGLYPSKPVVTDISHRALQSMPAESLRARLLGLSGGEPLSLSVLLDEIHSEGSGEPPSATGPVSEAAEQ